MHDSGEAPLKGQLMCMKTMSLIRTYMYKSAKSPSKGLLMCMYALSRFHCGWWF